MALLLLLVLLHLPLRLVAFGDYEDMGEGEGEGEEGERLRVVPQFTNSRCGIHSLYVLLLLSLLLSMLVLLLLGCVSPFHSFSSPFTFLTPPHAHLSLAPVEVGGESGRGLEEVKMQFNGERERERERGGDVV